MARTQATNDGYHNLILLEKIEKLYLNSETADVYFVFGDDDNRERIPAHKSLLAAGSDVFKAMFYGDLKETGDVEITDASADAFKEFLQFFYRSKVILTVENAFDVVNLGKKYDVMTCRTICERFLKGELTRNNDNVCSIYSLATYFDIDDVKKQCELQIVYDTEAVFSSSSFLDCDHSMLSRILKLVELSCPEIIMFHACMSWVKAKTKQEEVTREMVDAHLDDLFYEISFVSMTLDEFMYLTPSYGKLFSLAEHHQILEKIRSNDCEPKVFKKDHGQMSVPQWNRNAAIICNRTITGSFCGVYLFKTIEKITFSSNKPIWLGEIWCLPIKTALEHVLAEMTIHEISNDGSINALYTDANVIFNNKHFMKIITLTKPILIKPEFQYDIQFKHSSAQPVEYPDYNLMDKVQLPDTDIIIEFIGENKTAGIIYELDFIPI